MKFSRFRSFNSPSFVVFLLIALLVDGAHRASAQSQILRAESRGQVYGEGLRRSGDVLQSGQDFFFDGGIGGDERFEQTAPKASTANNLLLEPGKAGDDPPSNIGFEETLHDPGSNTRARSEQSRSARPADDKPFLPQGFRAGTWRIFTRLEQAVGFATNSSFAAGGRPGGFSQTDLTANLQSDWSRHQARIDVSGSLRRSLDSQDDIIPDAAVAGSLRLDLIDGFTAAFDAGYHYATEESSSRELNADVSDRPGIHRTTAAVELARTGGMFDIALRGSLNRAAYDDAKLTNGGTRAQGDRNNTLYEASMRIAYGASPALKPFVRAGTGWRLFDDPADRNGDKRSSRVLDLRGGIEFDAGEKFAGEIAVGYLREDYEGPALPRIDTVALDGNLVWSPERGTDVTFGVSTSLGGSTISGNPSTINRRLSLLAKRQVRDNLLVNALASAEIDQFPGGGGYDVTWTVGTGVEYFFSRFLSATANLEYQRLDSAIASQSWQGAALRLGIALQR